MSSGRSAVRTVDQVVFVANGGGGVVDELRLDDVVRVVGSIGLPAVSPGRAGTPDANALEQVRKLGELRAGGLLTDKEFEAKKTELLRRV